jgi:hypothetical protein
MGLLLGREQEQEDMVFCIYIVSVHYYEQEQERDIHLSQLKKRMTKSDVDLFFLGSYLMSV